MTNQEEIPEVTVQYEPLGECQYPVFAPNTPELERNCGEPAIYKVTWISYERMSTEWTDDDFEEHFHGTMLVCPEHYKTVQQEEQS